MSEVHGLAHHAVHEHVRSAWAALKPCELVSYHAPVPVLTEHHHSKPVYMQMKLYGREVYPADTYLCSSCHDSVHAWVYHRLSRWGYPVGIGRAAKAAGEATVQWYLSECERLGRVP